MYQKKKYPPQYYIETAWQWVNSFYSDPSMIREKYLPFDLGDTVFRSEPKRLEQDLDWVFHWSMTTKPLPSFAVILPRGRVVGYTGAVIAPNNSLVWDLSVEFSGSPERHSIFSMKQLPPVAYYPKTVAVLTSSVSQNYFHWMFEVLARIHLLRLSGIPVEKYVVNRQGYLPFQQETLDVVGLTADKLIDCHSFSHIEADQLVVPSLPCYTGHPPKWACDFLRYELMAKRGIQSILGYERIYVSRSDARYRKVINEDEVMTLLSAFGFRSVSLNQVSVYEQAQIFASAQVIVSPHGAGLANLVFCQAGTKVVEFFSPQYVNPVFWILSNQVKLDYHYLLGEGHRPVPPENPHLVTDNITLNIAALRNMMEKVLHG